MASSSHHGHDKATADRLSRFFAARPRVDSQAGQRSRLLRHVLVFLVLLLLGLVLLWPVFNERSDSITLSYKDIQLGGEQIRMQNARYSGSDLRDRPFMISADLALQEGVNAEKALLTGVKAQIEISDDNMVRVSAGEGVYRRLEEKLVLDGGIHFESDSGYELSVERAEVDLSSGIAQAASPVSGSAPFGSFSAESFALDSRARSLELQGRVRVRLEPGGKRGTGGATPDEAAAGSSQ